MKILISADMEGASGIVRFRECGYPHLPVGDPEATPDYLTGRRLLTGDINAAVEGAIEAGATAFVVHDTHGFHRCNIDLQELHPAVETIQGMPLIFYEHEALDSSYDAAFMIAMHAGAGQPGLLSHVLHWPYFQQVRINGQAVSEAHITTALASHFGVPTILVTGDDTICSDMKAWTNGQIEAVAVKYALSRYAARCLPLVEARKQIHEAACRAVKRIGEIQPVGFKPPITLEVDFLDRQVAWYVSFMPEVKRKDDRTISYTGYDFLSIYETLLAMFFIAESNAAPWKGVEI